MPNPKFCQSYRGAIVGLVKNIPVDKELAAQAQQVVETLTEEGVTGDALDRVTAAAAARQQALQDDYAQIKAFMDEYQNDLGCGDPYDIPGVRGLDIPPD